MELHPSLFVLVMGAWGGGLMLFVVISDWVPRAYLTVGAVVGFALPVLIIPLIGGSVRHTVLTSEDWEMVAKRLRASWYGLEEGPWN